MSITVVKAFCSFGYYRLGTARRQGLHLQEPEQQCTAAATQLSIQQNTARRTHQRSHAERTPIKAHSEWLGPLISPTLQQKTQRSMPDSAARKFAKDVIAGTTGGARTMSRNVRRTRRPITSFIPCDHRDGVQVALPWWRWAIHLTL
jgi:hypothetical protein